MKKFNSNQKFSFVKCFSILKEKIRIKRITHYQKKIKKVFLVKSPFFTSSFARFFKILLIEIKTFYRMPLAFIFPLFMPFIMFVAYGTMAGMIPHDKIVKYWHGILSRIMLLPLLSSSFIGLPIAIATNRVRKIYLRYYINGYSPFTVIYVQSFLYLFVNMITWTIICIVYPFATGVHVTFSRIFFGILFMLATSPAVFAIGGFIGGFFREIRSVQGIGTTTYFFMLFLSNIFYSQPGQASVPFGLYYLSPAFYVGEILILILFHDPTYLVNYGPNFNFDLTISFYLIMLAVFFTVFFIGFSYTFKWI